MTELSASEEIRLAEATSTFFRLIALDRAWTAVGRHPGLNDADVNALGLVADQMRELIGRSVEASYEVVRLASKAAPPSQEQDQALSDPAAADVFQTLLSRSGGITGLAQQGYETLSMTAGDDIAEVDRQMAILQAGGRIEGDLSRRFMCGLAKSLMAAGGITVWVPPHIHAAASVTAGATIYAANKCWELEPA